MSWQGQSDTDFGGVYIADNEVLMGLSEYYEPQISDEKHDTTYYELGRWVELLMKANPNALESLFDKGEEKGFEHFLDRIAFIRMTFDMGNALNKAAGATYSSPKEAEDFYEKYGKKAPYIHFKTTKDGVMQGKMVMDADVDFEKYFRMMPDDAWLCVEIPASENEAQTKENIIDALDSMKLFA